MISSVHERWGQSDIYDRPVPLAQTQRRRPGGMAELLRFRSYVGFLFACYSAPKLSLRREPC
jgi:hypothetical protein